MKNIKLEWWVILVLILWIIFLKECNTPKPCPEPTPAGTTVEHITTYDTILFHDTIKKIIHIPVAPPVSEIPNPNGDTTRVYNLAYEDSLIKGSIQSKVDGVLVDQKLIYTPKFPKYIIRTDSIKIKETFRDTINQAKFRILVGGRVGGNLSQFNAAAGLGIKTKKDNIYTLDYDFVHKTVNFNLYAPIRF